MSKFKAGDKVYFPQKSNKVLTLKDNDTDAPYILVTGTDTFTEDGKYREIDLLPSLLHATEENRAKLEAFHSIPFETAPPKPTSRDIIQAMLERGDLCVPCWASDSDENPDYTNACVLINLVSDGGFIDSYGIERKYATPFNPITGQPITELPD